jgi:hypothetical protein
MTLEIEPLPPIVPIEGNPSVEYVAVRYGPIVLAGRMGTAGLTPGSQLIVNERESGNMLQADVTVPGWPRPFEQLTSNIERTNPERLEFLASGFEGGAKVELIPWFRATHERYNLYWRRSSGPNG